MNINYGWILNGKFYGSHSNIALSYPGILFIGRDVERHSVNILPSLGKEPIGPREFQVESREYHYMIFGSAYEDAQVVKLYDSEHEFVTPGFDIGGYFMRDSDVENFSYLRRITYVKKVNPYCSSISYTEFLHTFLKRPERNLLTSDRIRRIYPGLDFEKKHLNTPELQAMHQDVLEQLGKIERGQCDAVML
jgi:hypothetical protein